jgi:hypothetical protein
MVYINFGAGAAGTSDGAALRYGSTKKIDVAPAPQHWFRIKLYL